MANTARGGGVSRASREGASRARRARVREVSAARRRRWGRGWSSPHGAPSRWSASRPGAGSLRVLVVLLLRDEVGGADGGGGDLREGAGGERRESGLRVSRAREARGLDGRRAATGTRRVRDGVFATEKDAETTTPETRRRENGRARARRTVAPTKPDTRRVLSLYHFFSSSSAMLVEGRGAGSRAGVSRGCVVSLAGTGRSKTA